MSPRTAVAAELEAARGDTPGEQISEMGGGGARTGARLAAVRVQGLSAKKATEKGPNDASERGRNVTSARARH